MSNQTCEMMISAQKLSSTEKIRNFPQFFSRISGLQCNSPGMGQALYNDWEKIAYKGGKKFEDLAIAGLFYRFALTTYLNLGVSEQIRRAHYHQVDGPGDFGFKLHASTKLGIVWYMEENNEAERDNGVYILYAFLGTHLDAMGRINSKVKRNLKKNFGKDLADAAQDYAANGNFANFENTKKKELRGIADAMSEKTVMVNLYCEYISDVESLVLTERLSRDELHKRIVDGFGEVTKLPSIIRAVLRSRDIELDHKFGIW